VALSLLAVLWRRLVVAPWLTDGGSKQRQRCSVFFQCFPVTLPVWFSSSFQLFLPLPMFWSSFFLPSVSLFFRFFLSLSSVFFSFVFSFSSVPSILFPPFFFSPSSPFSQRSWALFIEAKGAVFYSSHGEQPAGRPLGVAAEVRWVVCGGWSAIVSGRWAPGESGRQKFKKKQPFFPSSPLRDRGKKMNSVVQNDTVLLFLFLFFFECMKRRRFGEIQSLYF